MLPLQARVQSWWDQVLISSLAKFWSMNDLQMHRDCTNDLEMHPGSVQGIFVW